MRKIFKLLFFVMLCILPFNVYAISGSTNLKCNKTSVVPGEKITCTLTGNVSRGAVSAISSKITASSKLTLGTVTVDSAWVGDGEANLELYTDTNKTNSFGIASFDVTVSKDVQGSSNESITIDSTKFYDENYDEAAISKNVHPIKVLSTVNTLSTIKLSNGTLVPTFDSSILNYSVALDASSVTISATATDSTSKITGDFGNVSLKYGTNSFKINVISEANTTKTYTILITRPDDRATDNSLSSLIINGNNITLLDGQTEYTYEVDDSVKEVKIDSTLNDSKATFVSGYGPRTVALKDGKAEIELKVQAENEKIQTYKIIVKNKSVSNSTISDGKDTTNKSLGLENPKTGSSYIYIIVIVCVLSIIIGVGSYMFYRNKKVKKINEEK